AFDDYFHFACLQSTTHEHWARGAGLGSSLESRDRYTAATCFETFPFPHTDQASINNVAEAGQALYKARSAYMGKHDVGMTETWNRLLDPEHIDQRSAEIEELKRLKDEMGRAVLAAYGWSDLEPDDRELIVRRLRRLNVERAREEHR